MVQKHSPRSDGCTGQATEGRFVPHVFHLEENKDLSSPHVPGLGWVRKGNGMFVSQIQPQLNGGPDSKAFSF